MLTHQNIKVSQAVKISVILLLKIKFSHIVNLDLYKERDTQILQKPEYKTCTLTRLTCP